MTIEQLKKGETRGRPGRFHSSRCWPRVCHEAAEIAINSETRGPANHRRCIMKRTVNETWSDVNRSKSPSIAKYLAFPSEGNSSNNKLKLRRPLPLISDIIQLYQLHPPGDLWKIHIRPLLIFSNIGRIFVNCRSRSSETYKETLISNVNDNLNWLVSVN